ncbi:hypothetical protein [Flaviaesturariibacter amylovorans]|uniref:Uncharacterized protein n=1 Tax=Flaviaesturariibacter amylovorans TaxID=1084520 RepID=A0ABP8GBA3_9BACT
MENEIIQQRAYFIWKEDMLSSVMTLLETSSLQFSEFYYGGEDHPIDHLPTIVKIAGNRQHFSMVLEDVVSDRSRMTISKRNRVFSIFISSDWTSFEKYSIFYDEVIKSFDSLFICGNVYDYSFAKTQNETDVSNYELLIGKLPENTIYDNGVPFYIDISSNPGQEVELDAILLSATWKFYCDESFLDFLGIDTSSQSTSRWQKRQLTDTIVMFQLYSNPFLSNDHLDELMGFKRFLNIPQVANTHADSFGLWLSSRQI